MPGQFVSVRLNGFARDSALAIPQRAVQQALGRQFVYVVGTGDTVAARDVQPGPWSGSSGSSTRVSRPATAYRGRRPEGRPRPCGAPGAAGG